MTVHRMPAAEVDVSVELLRQLLAEQLPDLAGLPLGVLANGWDNIFWHAYGQADDHTRARARGWALSLALVFLTYSADNPLMAQIGKHTFREVLR